MEEIKVLKIKQKINTWWVTLLVGVLSVAVGMISIAHPLMTVGILTLFFIASFLTSGLFQIYFAITNKENIKRWGWVLVGGIINLVFASVLLFLPIANMLIFIFYIAFYILLQSVTAMWASFSLKSLGEQSWWYFLIFAILSALLGIFLIVQPGFAIGFISFIFAFSVICYGLFCISYAFKLRKLKKFLD